MSIENVSCPECDGPMVSRKNRLTQESFWGCKSFPVCKGTRDSMGKSKADRELEKRESRGDEDEGYDEDS